MRIELRIDLGSINRELMTEAINLEKTPERKWRVSPEESLGKNLRAAEKESQWRQQIRRLEEKHEYIT